MTEKHDQAWISTRLRNIGKSQADLARHMGSDNPKVNKVIKGIRQVDLAEIPAMAECLEMSGPACYLSLVNARFVEENEDIVRRFVGRPRNAGAAPTDFDETDAPVELLVKWRKICTLIAERSYERSGLDTTPHRQTIVDAYAVSLLSDALHALRQGIDELTLLHDLTHRSSQNNS